MGSNTGRGKVAYSWISPDPAKAGPTLGVVVVVLLVASPRPSWKNCYFVLWCKETWM